MMIPYSKVVGSNVVELKTQNLLGQVTDIVMRKSDLSVYGLLMKEPGFFQHNKMISREDVIQIADQVVIVPDDEVLMEHKEAVRLSEAIKKGYHGIGHKVVTKSGKNLGHVYDYIVSTTDLQIKKLYVKHIFSERIIGTKSVTGVKGKTIIVKDDYDLVEFAIPTVEVKMI